MEITMSDNRTVIGDARPGTTSPARGTLPGPDIIAADRTTRRCFSKGSQFRSHPRCDEHDTSALPDRGDAPPRQHASLAAMASTQMSMRRTARSARRELDGMPAKRQPHMAAVLDHLAFIGRERAAGSLTAAIVRASRSRRPRTVQAARRRSALIARSAWRKAP